MCKVTYYHVVCATITMTLFMSGVQSQFGLKPFGLVGPKSKNECGKVKCKSPPETGCKEVPSSDSSLPRPTGKNAKCCPLWKCMVGDQRSSYYTFHGNELGTETTHYTYDPKIGVFHVSSTSTGDHDSTANAITGIEGNELARSIQEMQLGAQRSMHQQQNKFQIEMENAFRQLGFPFGG